jgi:hypothetical protein
VGFECTIPASKQAKRLRPRGCCDRLMFLIPVFIDQATKLVLLPNKIHRQHQCTLQLVWGHGVLLVCTVCEILYGEIARSRKPFGIEHMYIHFFCLEWPILWPPKILTFPPATCCINGIASLYHILFRHNSALFFFDLSWTCTESYCFVDNFLKHQNY